jgi:hypothetical protein
MRWILLLVALIGMNAMAGEGRRDTSLDTLGSASAKAAVEEIWEQVLYYYQDRGRYPQTIEELIEQSYVKLDSTVLADWQFALRFDFPHFIRATRRTPIPYGLDNYPTVNFDVFRGQFNGTGIPRYGVDTLSIEQQSDLTKEVRKAIEDIADQLSVFYMERGRYPKTAQEMVQTRYVKLTPGVYVQWEFNLIGDPPVAIEATSSHVMPGGKGQVLQYDIQQKRFSGYGVRE